MLAQPRKGTYTAPEALFNLDETHLVNTLHAKNDAKRAAACRAADGDSEEEDLKDSASKEPDLERSPRGTAGNEEEDSNKTIMWSLLCSNEERCAG